MPEAEWKTDANGIVEGIPYHDFSIAGFRLEENDSFSISIRGEVGDSTLIRLERPTEICIERFYNGSILSEIYVWRVEEVPQLDPTIRDSGWNALLDSRYHQADMKRFAADIVRENCGSHLVVLSCSYGGTIAVVCSRMVFEL